MTPMPVREVPVPLRWSDMDAYGHVNNVQFVRLMEDARVLAFRTPRGDATGDGSVRTGTIVARNEIDYLLPLQYQYEPVTVALWISRVAGASFDVAYEVKGRVEDAPGDLPADEHGWVVYARAESTMVLYDLDRSRPRRITAEEREMLEELAGEPVALRRRTQEERRSAAG